MNFKELFLDKLDLYLEKKTPNKIISETLKKLKPYKIGKKLIRVGEEGDGGYLIPDDLDNIKYCFSAGVGNLTKFENDLLNKYQIKSIMADPSKIDKKLLPLNSKFFNKKISIYNSDTQININDFIDVNDEIILKIDIERDEYENIICLNEQKFNQIRILIIEFHDLRNLRSNFFCSLFNKILDRLNNIFYICHIHPNNTGKIKKIGNYNIPDMLEVTFINKNRLNFKPSETADLPSLLDRRINILKKEIFIDKNWFA